MYKLYVHIHFWVGPCMHVQQRHISQADSKQYYWTVLYQKYIIRTSVCWLDLSTWRLLRDSPHSSEVCASHPVHIRHSLPCSIKASCSCSDEVLVAGAWTLCAPPYDCHWCWKMIAAKFAHKSFVECRTSVHSTVCVCNLNSFNLYTWLQCLARRYSLLNWGACCHKFCWN